MFINKQYSLIILLFFNCFLVNIALPQTGGVGSGHNGNLRLCVVEGRGSYKRASRFCPVLDEQNSGVECVLGNDRLDCLRRMGKGSVDFGVFAPEDLVAAQWSQIEVLVTNELRNRPRPFERSIVAVVNRKILPESSSTVHAVLRNTTFCHPGHGSDDRQPMSDTISEYLETLVTEKLCNTSLSIMENRIRGMAQFFGKACIAGPWVTDEVRDAELKHRYPSLCAACGSVQCASEDRYWGPSGALLCLSEAAGDFTWAHLDNVAYYFGLVIGTKGFANPDDFAYLCRDGTWQPLTNNYEPCVWINRPWPVVVAKKKAAESVGKLAQSLTNSSVAVEGNWLGALAALLEVTQAQPEPLQPAQAPLDYLANARGFREAYSQTGCAPPRHISLCTTTPLETNKCEWLSEAGNVYGVAPPVQCASKRSAEECLRAVAAGDCDVSVAGSDWLVRGLRDFSLVPLLHEATPLIQKANTVVAYIRGEDELKNMVDWRQKRIAFPRYDGLAWHSVLRYFQDNNHLSCGQFVDYFSEICAPGIEAYNVTEDLKEKLTKNCYKDGEVILDGEEQALRSLVEGKSDIAFFSLSTYNKYKDKQIQYPWAANIKNLIPVCPEENKRFCFISWSNIGHVYAPQNLTSMRRQEIVNVFTQLDQLFGKNYPFHNAMFSMYGPFNHQIDVLFHNNTRSLVTDAILETHPYDKFPQNFESNLLSLTAKSCRLTDFARGFAAKSLPDFSLIVTVSLIFCFNQLMDY